MVDLKAELHRKLRIVRAGVLSRLDGLGEYELRRPMTPTGTNLLGLVKHLATMEYGYLGECFDRQPPETMSWVEDGSIWDGADLWATADESSEYVVGLYQRACEHGDQTVAELDLDAPGTVAHWPQERRSTTLGVLMIRMIAETAQHAGHADIVRELVDGRGGPDQDDIGDADQWRGYVSRIQSAADAHKPASCRPPAPARRRGYGLGRSLWPAASSLTSSSIRSARSPGRRLVPSIQRRYALR